MQNSGSKAQKRIASIGVNPALNEHLLACAQGDRAGLRRLYDALSPQLLALAHRMLRDRQAAEDLLQDTFLTVWTKSASFDPALGSAAGWITVIARNKCLDRLRSRSSFESAEDGVIEGIPDEMPLQDEIVATKGEAARVHHCMNKLTNPHRQAILLAYFHGDTHEEAAAKMNAPLGTLKSWIRRGLQQLKGCLSA